MKNLLFILLFISSFAFAQTTVRMSATATGTNTYSTTFNPTVSTFNQSTIYVIPFTNANSSGTITIDPDAGGAGSAISIKGADGNDLDVGAIVAGGSYEFKFNGTVLRMMGAWEQGTSGGATAAGATGNVQYKSAGGGLQAETAFTYDSATNILTVPLLKITSGSPGAGKVLSSDADGDAVWVSSSQEMIVMVTDDTTPIGAGIGKKTFYLPSGKTLTGVRAFLVTAQSSGSIFTIDINEGGTTVLSTKITIDNTEVDSNGAVTAPVISDSALADGAKISIDVDQIGSGTGAGLSIILYVN